MIKLDARLSAVAELVGKSSFVADVGSDHGYLPIYLVKSGQVDTAVASDVNQGPLDAANRNIKKEGLEDKITTRLANGLVGIEDFSFDTVIMAGMGGELIWSIIENAPCDYCRTKRPYLVLQPMSSVYELCQLLADGGFEIIDERLAFHSGKLYRALKVVYTGKKQDYTLLELHVGRINLDRGGELTDMMLEKLKLKYMRIVEGKNQSGEDTSFEKEMLRQIEERCLEGSGEK